MPPDTKLTDLSKLADLDMEKLPHPKESGDRCIRHIQEFLINKMSSAECGVLAEDKLQRLVVGVSTLGFFQQTLYKPEFVHLQPLFNLKLEFTFYCRLYDLQALNQLEIATHIERTALTMRLDSIRTLKSALAGTATSKFTDVMEAVFGVEEEFAPELEEEDPDETEGEGLPKVSSLKVQRGVPNPLLVRVLNVKQVVRLHLNVNKASLLKQVSVYLKMPPLCSLQMRRDTCTLGSLPNIFPNVREANTHKLLSTFVSMPKLSRPRVMMFLTARSCVNKRHRSPVTFDNSTSGIVLPVIYAIISGGLPLSGINI